MLILQCPRCIMSARVPPLVAWVHPVLAPHHGVLPCLDTNPVTQLQTVKTMSDLSFIAHQTSKRNFSFSYHQFCQQFHLQRSPQRLVTTDDWVVWKLANPPSLPSWVTVIGVVSKPGSWMMGTSCKTSFILGSARAAAAGVIGAPNFRVSVVDPKWWVVLWTEAGTMCDGSTGWWFDDVGRKSFFSRFTPDGGGWGGNAAPSIKGVTWESEPGTELSRLLGGTCTTSNMAPSSRSASSKVSANFTCRDNRIVLKAVQFAWGIVILRQINIIVQGHSRWVIMVRARIM